MKVLTNSKQASQSHKAEVILHSGLFILPPLLQQLTNCTALLPQSPANIALFPTPFPISALSHSPSFSVFHRTTNFVLNLRNIPKPGELQGHSRSYIWSCSTFKKTPSETLLETTPMCTKINRNQKTQNNLYFRVNWKSVLLLLNSFTCE